MTVALVRDGPPRREFRPQRARILVVSEDPYFITRVRSVAEVEGAFLTACLGPVASPCVLNDEAVCPLAKTSDVVLVDSPPSGVFRYHLEEVQVGDYAERVQRAHPHAFVVLIAGPEGRLGPTGEVATTGDRVEALHLVRWVLRAVAIRGTRRVPN